MGLISTDVGSSEGCTNISQIGEVDQIMQQRRMHYLLEKEECALDMGRVLSDAVVTGAQITQSVEEWCASCMEGSSD
eukprot:scaffold28739_cov94-Skeletonema_dohrnii-CCMP3373.AAC.1